MKTAEINSLEVCKNNAGGNPYQIIDQESRPLFTGTEQQCNEVLALLQSYASHPSPVMSAEQVEEMAEKYASEEFDMDSLAEFKIAENVLWENRKDDFISGYKAASPSVKADGWVRIVTKKDLPKERMYCWFYDKENGCVAGEFLNNGKDEINYILANATHYKPISLPAPPNVNNK